VTIELSILSEWPLVEISCSVLCIAAIAARCKSDGTITTL
jgi:hypothetical protein